MATDIVKYLNKPGEANAPLSSKLINAVAEVKQNKASAGQWLAMIKAMTQKGIKQIEMEESRALSWLQTLDPAQVLAKEELLKEIARRYYTIKEVILDVPKYPTYRQPGGSYSEYLYIANSERANIEDELEDVNFDLEEMQLDPILLSTDPGRALMLERKREALLTYTEQAIEFASHHFSEKINGKHGKNLLAHVRVSIHGDTYFIDEIQSDWAQRGRACNWQGIPRGPLVTNTEAWAGMVLRRHLQIAATMPGIARVAWITESMRNGGKQRLGEEKAKDEQRKAYRDFIAHHTSETLSRTQAEGMTPEQLASLKELASTAAKQAAASMGLREPHDMLNDFYLQVVPKLVDKALGKTGKTEFQEFKLDDQVAMGSYGSGVVNEPNMIKVPAVTVTEAMREQMSKSQPVYSRAPLTLKKRTSDDIAMLQAEALKQAKVMIGSIRQIRFAAHVYDVATGKEVAGKYLNGLIHVSMRGKDPIETTAHECFHFAYDKLMTPQEIELIRREFAPGTELNYRVRETLGRHLKDDAARQCKDPVEAAAHAFTMWQRGLISFTEKPIQGLFADITNAFKEAARWFKKVVLQHRSTTVEELFQALNDGTMTIGHGETPAVVEPTLEQAGDGLSVEQSREQPVGG